LGIEVNFSHGGLCVLLRKPVVFNKNRHFYAVDRHTINAIIQRDQRV